jgi:hypothetical protein
MENHEGGCLCGAVRYRVHGEPARSSVCHCTYCQKRTGSAFGIGAYFRAEQVELTRGRLTAYEHRSDESGRWLRNEFCPVCGVIVTWTAEALPGLRAIAGGTFDDPTWIRPDRHGWTRSAHPWVAMPPGAQVFEKSAMLPTAS